MCFRKTYVTRKCWKHAGFLHKFAWSVLISKVFKNRFAQHVRSETAKNMNVFYINLHDSDSFQTFLMCFRKTHVTWKCWKQASFLHKSAWCVFISRAFKTVSLNTCDPKLLKNMQVFCINLHDSDLFETVLMCFRRTYVTRKCWKHACFLHKSAWFIFISRAFRTVALNMCDPKLLKTCRFSA